jgi:hypothetical protein
VEHLRSQVRPVRPDDGPRLRIDLDTLELLGVTEGLEQRSVQLAFQIELPGYSVGEADPEPVVAERFDRRHRGHDRQTLLTVAKWALELATSPEISTARSKLGGRI